MLFLSTYQNRIDKKGRVSVPASFRAALAGQEFSGIVAYGSLLHACIEGCGMNRFMKLNERIEMLDPFSEERDAFATTIFGESVQLPFDGEGRIMLPEHLISTAGISEQAVFVGKGEIFEIWEPKAFGEHAARAREVARDKRFQLRGTPTNGGKA
ncbi:MAG: division/cell wall cluster transcriptional repressor MraZ [Rickettsiales bacterium]|nr:division/cell wall cluster transcriptional repressor MraZ [Rickettsiales bacterium]